MRYIVSFLIAIGLIVLFIIILLKAIFGGGGQTPVENQVNLADYEKTDVVMQLVIDGPVTADELHSQVRIAVGRDTSTIQIIRGYQGEVVRQEHFNSNSSAYGNFLRAIDLLGYTQGDKNKAMADYRGHCPFGSRYVFQTLDGSKVKEQFWATSCGTNEGSFRGQADQVVQVFKAQIPEYDELTGELGLN